MTTNTSKAITSATTKIYISASLPATYDAAGFAALTWVEIPDVTNIGEFGGTNSVITHTPVGTAIQSKLSGSTDPGTLSVQSARTSEAALTTVRAAYKSRASTAFKVAYPTQLAETDYFTALVTSNKTNVGGADQVLGFSFDVALNNEVVTVTA